MNWFFYDRDLRHGRVKRTYPNTRYMFQFTKFFCEKPRPSSFRVPFIQATSAVGILIESLIGIAPFGAVNFISNLYPGSTYDKEIVLQSSFTKWSTLEKKNDSIEAYRGVLISD